MQWKQITEQVKEELTTFSFKPTLRTMYYRLIAKELIPNTRSSYNSFGRETVKARWDGRLAIDCFEDSERQVVSDFDDEYLAPDEIIEDRIETLLNTEKDYTDYIPRWHNQPHYVEVWIEKKAMTGTFRSILEGYDVRIVPNRGFTSMTFLYEAVKRLVYYKHQGKSIHILYYGDFDPSGDYMDTDLINRMAKMGFRVFDNGKGKGNATHFDVTFERIAVTLEQIKKYKLPYKPDQPTSKKLKGDNRTKRFLAKYGKMYAVELDALPALIPDIFRQQLVIDKVEQYYDKDIYEESLKEYSPSDVKKLLNQTIKKTLKKLS